mgnify:CR=1 FL=1
MFHHHYQVVNYNCCSKLWSLISRFCYVLRGQETAIAHASKTFLVRKQTWTSWYHWNSQFYCLLVFVQLRGLKDVFRTFYLMAIPRVTPISKSRRNHIIKFKYLVFRFFWTIQFHVYYTVDILSGSCKLQLAVFKCVTFILGFSRLT